jgi:4-diphosphocytidyl-2C-methyl-D-erythritol kinase
MSKTLTEAPDRVNLRDVLEDGAAVEDLLFNDLQSVAEELYPEINQARTFLEEITESPTLMTGSGPTVFSLMRAAARDNERIEHRCPGNWWSKRARPVCAGPVLE